MAFALEDITEAGHGVFCERSPLTSDIEDDPSLRMSPLNIDVHDMKHNVTRNDLAAISKCSGASGSKSRSLLKKIANLDKVATRKGDRNARFSKTKFSDPSSWASVGDGFIVNASSDTAARRRVDYQETIMTRTKSKKTLTSARRRVGYQETIRTRTQSKRTLTSGSSARRQLIAISPKSARTISAEKKKNRKGRSGSPYSEGTCNAAAAVRQGMDPQEAIMTWRKSKRNLTSESLAERKLIAISPESAETISKVKKGSKVIILSPESFGGKKSRSGRVLLPRLEFWRNQIVLYDPDRKVCGIEEHM